MYSILEKFFFNLGSEYGKIVVYNVFRYNHSVSVQSQIHCTTVYYSVYYSLQYIVRQSTVHCTVPVHHSIIQSIIHYSTLQYKITPIVNKYFDRKHQV